MIARRGGPAAAPGGSEQVDHAAQLQQASESLGLGLPQAVRDQLLAYAALLERWNGTYNLTALRDPGRMLTHHLIDCLAALPALRRHADGRALKVLDVGSGGGLPGLAWAIAQPDWAVHCVDAVAKKVAFIRQAAGELGLAPRVQALHARAEALPMIDTGYDLIASRALGSLAELTAMTGRLLGRDGIWLALKGRIPDDEVTALPPAVEVFHVEPLAVPGLDAQRCLVWMRPRAVAAGRPAD